MSPRDLDFRDVRISIDIHTCFELVQVMNLVKQHCSSKYGFCWVLMFEYRIKNTSSSSHPIRIMVRESFYTNTLRIVVLVMILTREAVTITVRGATRI